MRGPLLFNVLFNACLLALLLSTASLAQERRTSVVPFHGQEPKPAIRVSHFNRKVFVAEVSLLAASTTADAITTRQVLDRGWRETNPLFGPHPSAAKQAGVSAGIFAAQSALLYLTEHNRHAWVRWTGRVFLAHEIEEHLHFAVCNAGEIRNCRSYGNF